MNKPALRAGIAGLALAATVGLAGCGGGNTGNMPVGSGTPASSQTPSLSSSSSATADFNDADVTFTQMMIPHHTQAVAMSDTILKKSGVNADVTALAQQIKDAQQPEITTMTGWLKSWGKDMGSGGMSGMDMGDGMATDAELKQLDQADGPTAQKMYLEMMTKHHQGAIKMAQTEITNGKNPDAVQLAKNIATTQQKEITTIKQLLTRL